MMKLDGHIHMEYGKCDSPEQFLEKTANAGVGGGAVFSLAPNAFYNLKDENSDWRFRMDRILEFTAKTPSFAPFFWIDPQESDALLQLEEAKKSGIRGFKVICDRFFAASRLDFFTAIGEIDLPLMFHSGILWDGKVSSEFNRPVSFESLLAIPKLRFSLAHVSWPWCDECIALFGKFQQAERRGTRGNGAKFFIDTTPGTPYLYRADMLRKLYLSGYNTFPRAFFGSDCSCNDYRSAHVRKWAEFDRSLMLEMDRSPLPPDDRDNPFLPSPETMPSFSKAWEDAYCVNFRRFLTNEEEISAES